jgi:protein-tyrosine phosphatase
MVKVLFVCTGNICRSPTAEGVFRKLVEDAGLGASIQIDSAGTGAWHIGEAPDPRTSEAALARGFELSAIRARKVAVDDFPGFDYVVAMDKTNQGELRGLAPNDMRAKVYLFLDFTEAHKGEGVPDPYYGGEGGFEHVLDLVEDGAQHLLAHIQNTDL